MDTNSREIKQAPDPALNPTHVTWYRQRVSANNPSTALLLWFPALPPPLAPEVLRAAMRTLSTRAKLSSTEAGDEEGEGDDAG